MPCMAGTRKGEGLWLARATSRRLVARGRRSRARRSGSSRTCSPARVGAGLQVRDDNGIPHALKGMIDILTVK